MREELNAGFWCGNLREGDHFEDLDLDGKINIKMDPTGSEIEFTDRNDLAQDWDTWGAFLNAVMNFRVH